MEPKKISRTARFFLSMAVLIGGMGASAQIAWAQSRPEGWVLGDRLLAGALFLIAFGWVIGIYAIFFINTAPLIKRVMLYPLIKIAGAQGEKSSLITKR
jgi:hypothetical protein